MRANFKFCSKICGDRRKNFATYNAGVVNTGGKFVTWCKWYWQQIYLRCQRHWWKLATGLNNTAVNFPLVSTTLVVHLELLLSPRIFENIGSVPYGTFRGLGETDSWKTPEVENLLWLLEKVFWKRRIDRCSITCGCFLAWASAVHSTCTVVWSSLTSLYAFSRCRKQGWVYKTLTTVS